MSELGHSMGWPFADHWSLAMTDAVSEALERAAKRAALAAAEDTMEKKTPPDEKVEKAQEKSRPGVVQFEVSI